MEIQSQFFCTFLSVLISILVSILYQNKDRNRKFHYDKEVSMTRLIENNLEKEIQIRNLTEENHDLRKLISQLSEVITELYDCKKRLELAV